MSAYEWLGELLAVVEAISKNEVGTDVTIAHLKDELAKMSDIGKPKLSADSETETG